METDLPKINFQQGQNKLEIHLMPLILLICRYQKGIIFVFVL